MPRVKRGVTARAAHKKVLKQAKGYRGARSRVFRVAKQAVTKAGQYAYRDSKAKKRMFRRLWIARINAAAREQGITYSRLMQGLKAAENRGRPEDARRSRDRRFGGVRRHRRQGEGEPAGLTGRDRVRRRARRRPNR